MYQNKRYGSVAEQKGFIMSLIFSPVKNKMETCDR